MRSSACTHARLRYVFPQTNLPLYLFSLHVPGASDGRDARTEALLERHLARRALYSRGSQTVSQRMAVLRELERYVFSML